MTIEAKIINKGYSLQIQIISVTYGYAQKLENNKWVNTTVEPQRFEDEVLTLGKYFLDDIEAESFMQKKFFKSLFKNIQKNWI
jgi:hypothetical protein